MTQMTALIVAYATVDADPVVVDYLILTGPFPVSISPICRLRTERYGSLRPTEQISLPGTALVVD